MSVLVTEDIATHLSNEGYGDLGTELFIDSIPKGSQDNIIVVYSSGGSNDDSHMSDTAGEVSFENKDILIRVRNNSKETAATTIYNIYKELNNLSVTIDSVDYVHIRKESDVIPMGYDETGRFSYSMMFSVKRR